MLELKKGSIVNIKNIIFNGNVVDHAMCVGRPCIFIGELNEKMYFLPLTSNYNYDLDVVLEPNKINHLKKKCGINIKTIVEKPACCYEVIGEISNYQLYRMYKMLLLYYKTPFDEKAKNAFKIGFEFLDEEEKKKMPKCVNCYTKKTKKMRLK